MRIQTLFAASPPWEEKPNKITKIKKRFLKEKNTGVLVILVSTKKGERQGTLLDEFGAIIKWLANPSILI